jgi:serine/threonine protein phosphatase 1
MAERATTLPDGLRLYAIGDVHGRFDLLIALAARIAQDLAERPPRQSREIFLGDYVDRGPQSREVLDWLIDAPPLCDERICLMGNHEAMFLAALADPAELDLWLINGGLATLASYAGQPAEELARLSRAELFAVLQTAVPRHHRDLLSGLQRMALFPGYIFVHAGLRPGRPLEAQRAEDMIWIREPFLSSRADFGALVVHGHTPVDVPELLPNRINIDTGAFFTGRLTCLVLEGQSRRLIQVAG